MLDILSTCIDNVSDLNFRSQVKEPWITPLPLELVKDKDHANKKEKKN